MGLLSRGICLARNLARGRRLDHELDAELSSYVDLLTDEYVARGMDPERARRSALLALGGVEQVKEEVRGVRAGALLEQIVLDVRYAVRGLRKAPVFTATAIVTLALGIGANAAMFSVVDALLFRPIAAADPDRLVAVYTGASGNESAFSYPDFVSLSERTDIFGGVAGWGTQLAWIRNGGDIDRITVHTVSPGYFNVVGVIPQSGVTFATANDDASRGTIVISDRCWRLRFGADPAVLGRWLTLSGLPVSIIGVAPAGFSGLDPSAPADGWVTHATLAMIEPGWDFRAPAEIWLHLIARLRPGVSRASSESALAPLAPLAPGKQPRRIRLVPAATPVFDPETRAASSQLGALVFGVAAFVLLTACANVANLLLVRGSVRRREIGLRMAVGASRGRVARQMVTECIVLAAVGCAAGLLVAHWTIQAVVAFAPRAAIPAGITVALDGRVVLFAIVVSALTALAFGVAPAWQAVRLDVLPNIKGGQQSDSAGGRRTFYFRRALVICQVALSVVLLVGAGLFLRTLSATLSVQPGYDVSRVLLMTIDFSVPDMTTDVARIAGDQILERVRALPGVEGAAFGQIVPFSGAFVMRPVLPAGTIVDQAEADNFNTPYGVVSDGYFRALGMPLRGRDFAATDTEDAPRVAIVNETLARRLWPGQDAIGKRVTMPLRQPGPGIEVIGVVPDGKYVELTEAQHPFIYMPLKQMHRPRVTLHVRTTGAPAASVAPVRAAIREVSPDIPAFNATTLATYLDRSTAQPRVLARLLVIFGAIALTVAAVGVYGLTAYTVARRTKELGVRTALGARPSDLVRMLVSQSAVLVCAGLAAGLLSAILLSRFIRTFLFGIAPSDPIAFAAGSAVLAVTMVVATILPARRATRVDPLAALRAD
jgi:predicted permease